MMVHGKRDRIRVCVSACLFVFLMTEIEHQSVCAETHVDREDAEDIHNYLKETFPEFLYHGAYLDDQNHYLVISLKIHAGNLAQKMDQGSAAIDEILTRAIIKDLYKRRFSYYLFGQPQIKGVSVILTWEGCRRVRDDQGVEKILLKQGRSEFDRFDVSRGLYFEKLGLMQNISDPVSAVNLFDEITFSHLEGETYKGMRFHEASNTP